MVAEQSLAGLQLDEYTFTSGFGRMSGYVYHNLPDAVGMHYLTGSPSDSERFGEEAARLAEMTRDLALEYTTYGSRLIGWALRSFGFRRRVGMSAPGA